MLHFCRHKQVDFSIKTTWCCFATKHRQPCMIALAKPMNSKETNCASNLAGVSCIEIRLNIATMQKNTQLVDKIQFQLATRLFLNFL